MPGQIWSASMHWIRVRIKNTRELTVPDICPNCLETPADVPTPIKRTVFAPDLASSTTHGQWPFCAFCSDWVSRPTRWERRFGILPALGLLLLAAIVAVATMLWSNGVHNTAYWLLLAAIVVGFVGTVIPTLIHMVNRKPSKCLSVYPTVKPIKSGRSFLSGKIAATYKFAHPVYGERLMAENDPDNVEVDEQQLRKSKFVYEKKQAKTARI